MSSSHSHSLQGLMVAVDQWTSCTFGAQPTVSYLGKLGEEVYELSLDPTNRLEFADCLILLLKAAVLAGYNAQDLIDAGFEKLEINKKRQWMLTKSGLFYHHVAAEDGDG